MPEQIATFQEFPQFSQQVVIGGVEMRLRITYRSRLASWYLDAFDLDDAPIVTGRRLSPGFVPMLGLALETIDPPALPEDVVWYVVGPADYVREDLGDTLGLFIIDRADLPATPATGDAVTVTVAP